MSKELVKITLEVPADLLDVLADHGTEFLAAVELLISKAKQREYKQVIQEKRRLQKQRMAEWAHKRLQIGRKGHRLLRQRLATLPKNVKGAERVKRRADFIRVIAVELGHEAYSVELCIKQHRKILLGRVSERQRLYAVRHYLCGSTNKDIADRFSTYSAKITLLIREAKKAARDKGLTLSEYERHLTQLRHAEIRAGHKASEPKTNIIDWPAVQKMRVRLK